MCGHVEDVFVFTGAHVKDFGIATGTLGLGPAIFKGVSTCVLVKGLLCLRVSTWRHFSVYVCPRGGALARPR